jgi:MFS family permease
MTTIDSMKDRLLSRSYRQRFLAIMFLVSSFNYADRAVFAVLAQPIKEDLRLTDFQLGLLQGFSFAILYAVLGLPIGRLAERVSRVWIVATATAFFSLMTAACGLAGNFIQLMFARIGVGVGEAGFHPPTSSIIGDIFPRTSRASAVSLIMLGTPVGTLLGSFAGGFATSGWGWRAAFFVLGVPGLVVALLVLLFVREPSRGLVDDLPVTKAPPPRFTVFLRTFVKKRALMLIFLGGTTAGFGMSSIAQFLAVFIAREYQTTILHAALLYGVIAGIYLTIGFLLGSFGTDFLARRGDARWPAWGAAFGLLSAPLVLALAFSIHDLTIASCLLVVGGSLLFLYTGPTQGMIQNMLEPQMRATGIALFFLLFTLIGSGLGPPFIGFVSDRFASASFTQGDYLTQCAGGRAVVDILQSVQQACADAAALGVRRALLASICIFFASGVCYLLASRTLRDDLYDPEAAQTK